MSPPTDRAPGRPSSSLVTQQVARLLLAPIMMIALAILIKGYASVGDGFSAGVIAALGILLQYLALGASEAERILPLRLIPPLAFAGMLLALAIALLPLLWGDPLLTHAPAPGSEVIHIGTLELITAVAFDVAIFLLVVGSAVGIIHAIARTAEEAG